MTDVTHSSGMTPFFLSGNSPQKNRGGTAATLDELLRKWMGFFR